MLFSGPTTCPFQPKICDLTGDLTCVTWAGKYSVYSFGFLMYSVCGICSNNLCYLNDCLEGAELIIKYKPQIVVWFIRDIRSSLDVSGSRMRVGMMAR